VRRRSTPGEPFYRGLPDFAMLLEFRWSIFWRLVCFEIA